MPGLLRRGTREAAPEGPGGWCQRAGAAEGAAGGAGQSWRRGRAGPAAAGGTGGDSQAAPRLRLRLQGEDLLSDGGGTEMRVVRGCDGRGMSANPGAAPHPLGVL